MAESESQNGYEPILSKLNDKIEELHPDQPHSLEITELLVNPVGKVMIEPHITDNGWVVLLAKDEKGQIVGKCACGVRPDTELVFNRDGSLMTGSHGEPVYEAVMKAVFHKFHPQDFPELFGYADRESIQKAIQTGKALSGFEGVYGGANAWEVLQEYRRTGLGSIIFECMVDIVKKRGATRLYIGDLSEASTKSLAKYGLAKKQNVDINQVQYMALKRALMNKNSIKEMNKEGTI